MSKKDKLRGRPFRPVKSTAVDMFPHTEHCELVTLFERM
jgi:tRNA (uracil-5-)-methyltransferase